VNQLLDLSQVGLKWDESGQAGLTGPLLSLADGCDRAFRLLARRWSACEERYPAALPASLLTGHLRSFPHQAMFPVALDRAEANLGDFAEGQVVAHDGQVRLTRTAPVTSVLTPAACYHVYAGHRGEELTEPLYVTTRNTCFRNEAEYRPLRRQWSFSMREIVCVGTPVEAVSLFASAREAVTGFAERIGLPLRWEPATDPFFRPRGQPGYLMQRLQPTKYEAVYGGDLALASVNLHHDHFGATFGIARDGVPASSACVAFGLERWLFAIVDRHGPDPSSWPGVTA
jgi:hypothetical protein